MELTFVVAVKDIWQLQPSWLHPCKVCDQGHSVGKIKFTRNRKMVGLGVSSRENLEIKDAKRCIVTLFKTMFWKLGLRRIFWK